MKPHKIKTTRYPYGRVNKRLKKAAEWLNKNMNDIMEKAKKQYVELDSDMLDEAEAKDEILYADCFNYPHYWGLPKSIAHQLDPDEVDFIQEETYEWWPK